MKKSILIVMISILFISLWGHGGFDNIGNSLDMWADIIDFEYIKDLTLNLDFDILK